MTRVYTNLANGIHAMTPTEGQTTTEAKGVKRPRYLYNPTVQPLDFSAASRLYNEASLEKEAADAEFEAAAMALRNARNRRNRADSALAMADKRFREKLLGEHTLNEATGAKTP